MAETIRCPMCSKPNPKDLDVCQSCGARLKPLISTSPDSSRSIKAGEQPIEKSTTEFEKVKPVSPGSIHAGEAPTPKNTAELERALPSWLRSLRGDDTAADLGPESEAPSGEDLTLRPSGAQAPLSPGKTTDWLAGLNKVSAEEEEAVPDWLSGLRNEEKKPPSTGNSSFESEPGADLGSADWMSRLDSSSSSAPAEPSFLQPSPEPTPVAPDESKPVTDWLKALQSAEAPASEPSAPGQGEEKIPDWFSGLPGVSTDHPSETEPPAPAESQPAWLDQLEAKSAGPADETPPPAGPAPHEGLPDWLGQMQEKAAASGPAFPAEAAVPNAAGDIPDWLSKFQEKGAVPEETPPADHGTVPDWLSNLESPAEAPAAGSGEPLPDWLSSLEGKSGAEAESVPALSEDKPAVEIPHVEELPSWLSQMQTEAKTDAEATKPQAAFETGPAASLPDWLEGIEPGTPRTAETPAFVSEEKTAAPAPEETVEKPFSMETPDWLSKVTPEQTAEKSANPPEEQPSASELHAAELPSWVQAMRPVESVVDQTKPPALEENQITEQSGPLAGLAGVLPAGPGLGMSRKPPAYSIKLQVSNTQQRYITDLEKLVTGETRPSAAKGERQQARQTWRWLIAALLILAVVVPFVLPQARITPPSVLLSSDKGATKALLEGLPVHAPVLVAFDYDPALSGELETASAPLIDALQSKDARLTLVSTSPTGPALAERFFRNTLLVNSHPYKSGDQYINLGYIAGGPAGISLFASDPSKAMPVMVSGKSAWSLPPLQGVSKLGDFAAVIILTGDADTGRNWVEQAGPYLDKAPMVMVISAQAMPMVRPYFDSGQLKGLVSGLEDAKIYEQDYNRPGLANHYWDSFSLAGLIAELVIAVGAAWSALAAWRLHPSRPKGKA